MSPTQRTTLFINVGHTLDHMAMLVFPTAVLGMGDAFGLGYADLLTLSLGGFLAFGLGSVPAGWLGDLWSRRGMMAVFFVGIGLGLILTGFATKPWMLAAGLTLVGLFAAIYHPVGTAMLVATTDKVGRAIGTNAVFGNIGISGAAVLAGVLTEEFGWRAAFMVPGVLSLAVGAAFVLLAPPEPRRGGLKRSQGPAIGRRTMVRAFVVVAVGTFAMGLASNVLSVAVPKLFAERLGDALSLKTIGLLTTGAFLFGSIAQFTVGRAIDRFGIRRSYLPLTFFMVPAYALTAVLAGPGLFPAVAVAAMTTFGTVTVNDSMVARYTGEKWRARAYAVRYLVGFGASAAAVQFVAVMHERSGFTGVFVTLAVVSAIVLATALFTPREEAAAVGRAQAARPAPAE